MTASLGVWWPRSPAPGNFGDVLTPHILGHYGIAHGWATLKTAEAICTGSVIRFARKGMVVMGSGAMRATDRVDPGARILWTRGPLTREVVLASGGECPDIYGDPAMLLPRVFPRTVEPMYEVGYFPHYVDLEHVHGLPAVINPLWPVQVVLRALWKCKRIVSSSLHGIIAAHAYGIPAAWVKLSDNLDGDDIKFHDHAQAVGLPEMPLSSLINPVFTLPRYDDSRIHGILRGMSGH